MARPSPVPCPSVGAPRRVNSSKIRSRSGDRDAGTVVDQAQLEPPTSHSAADVDRTPGRIVDGDVLEQVHEHVFHEQRVDAKVRQLGIEVEVDRPAVERAPGTVDRDAHEVDGRDGHELGSECAGADPRELEDLVHQPFEPGRLGEGVLEQLPSLARVEAGVLGEERRGRGLDGGERRPEVVGDPGQEPRTRPVELALHPLLARGGLDPFELEGGRHRARDARDGLDLVIPGACARSGA